jgi:hypothetical protein
VRKVDELKLYRWFRENNVLSIGPHTGMGLVRVAEETRKKLTGAEDPETRRLLDTYLKCLGVVTHVAAIHQRAVLDELAACLEATGETKKSDSEGGR